MGQPRVGFVPRAQEASLATAEHGSRHGKPTPPQQKLPTQQQTFWGRNQSLQRKTFQSQVARMRAHPLPSTLRDSPGEAGLP